MPLKNFEIDTKYQKMFPKVRLSAGPHGLLEYMIRYQLKGGSKDFTDTKHIMETSHFFSQQLHSIEAEAQAGVPVTSGSPTKIVFPASRDLSELLTCEEGGASIASTNTLQLGLAINRGGEAYEAILWYGLVETIIHHHLLPILSGTTDRSPINLGEDSTIPLLINELSNVSGFPANEVGACAVDRDKLERTLYSKMMQPMKNAEILLQRIDQLKLSEVWKVPMLMNGHEIMAVRL